jgi:hypothetical protein
MTGLVWTAFASKARRASPIEKPPRSPGMLRAPPLRSARELPQPNDHLCGPTRSAPDCAASLERSVWDRQALGQLPFASPRRDRAQLVWSCRPIHDLRAPAREIIEAALCPIVAAARALQSQRVRGPPLGPSPRGSGPQVPPTAPGGTTVPSASITAYPHWGGSM